MIEINLLPEEMRRKKMAYLKLDINKDRLKIVVFSGAAAVMMMLVLFLTIGAGLKKGRIVKLKAEEGRLAAEKSEAEALNRELVLLRSRISAAEDLVKRDFFWSRKLNELSDMVLPGMWFTRIYADSENRFIIEGSVISKKEEAMAVVGKFMKNAGDNRLFFKDFSNMKLESIQRKGTDERDVVDFRIALYF